MNKAPAVSILTPVWNGLPFLKESIASVQAQDFQSWELLISDNGSTDGTIAYLDTLTDPRIRIFKQKKNLGIMGNLNFLFDKAEAPISQILCADDYFIHTHSLSTVISYWESVPAELGFAGFNHHSRPSSCIIKLENEVIPAMIPPAKADILFFIFGNILGNLSNVTLRTHIVKETGYFDGSIPSAGDFDFWCRAARKYTMGMQKRPIAHIRMHKGAASNYMSLKGETFLEKIKIYEKLIQRLAESHGYRKLVVYFNFQISTMHYRLGIKSALNGRFSYLKCFTNAHSSILWPKLLLLTAGLPLSVLNRKQRLNLVMAKAMLREAGDIKYTI